MIYKINRELINSWAGVLAWMHSYFALMWWEHFTRRCMQCTATMPITSRLRGPIWWGEFKEINEISTKKFRTAHKSSVSRHGSKFTQRLQDSTSEHMRTRYKQLKMHINAQKWKNWVLPTRSPAFFTARGKPSSPVPMFPFSKWTNVCKKLQRDEKWNFMKRRLTVHTNITHGKSLTRIRLCPQFARTRSACGKGCWGGWVHHHHHLPGCC